MTDDSAIPTKLTASTLTSQVEEYITTLIKEQSLKPGDLVPSEMQLAQALGISRGIVREAYRSLGTLGIIEIKSGRKPRVKAFGSSVLEMLLNFASTTAQVKLSEIIELREGLELSCVTLAAQRITDEEIVELSHEMDNIRTCIEDARAFIEHDLRFHNLIAQASHNFLYTLLLQALHQQIVLSIKGGFELQSTQEQRRRIIELHQSIYEALSNHDVEAAAKSTHEHFSTVSAVVTTNKPNENK